ncbi:hypothetical protein Pmani_032972 [Petrolisthes manimaculis]|uniref:SGNH hydrolase-type esterase domain-containing protein n=1 Tax=Petrolisthes manimaculis TaxID=1843537 RepID=A0AAE1NRX1_9EUCA|nr:hypothetical protein Pmani_032972 [Petrolisthes manimaculis]
MPPTPCPLDDTPTQEDSTEPERSDLHHIAKEIEMINSKLATKDMEIELLNTEVKAAYHTIEQLQHRVTELEKHHCGSRNHHTSAGRHAPSDTCLLLGDTNLNSIISSDLHTSCRVRTIPGANMDRLRCWVNEKLRKSPSDCIIYCGTNDTIEENSSAKILDNLGALISELKEKNNSINVYVCNVVPYSTHEDIQERIEGFNNDVVKWAETNGIPVIDTVPTFTLGTGELDDLCFDKKTGLHSTLNRLGVIKLLGTINKQCPQFKLCPNWEEVRRDTRTYTAQTGERRGTGQGGTGGPPPRPPAPHADTPARPTIAHLQAASSAHNYERSTSPHLPLTTSSKPASYRSSTTPSAASHRSLGRTMRREQAGDGSSVRCEPGPYTYAAALSRGTREQHRTAHSRSLVHSSGRREQRGDDSPQSFTSVPVLEEEEHYPFVDDSQRYQTDRHTGSRRKW